MNGLHQQSVLSLDHRPQSYRPSGLQPLPAEKEIAVFLPSSVEFPSGSKKVMTKGVVIKAASSPW